ncbi:MAG: hypothetical protein HY263_11090 [Chloroflexi bacterium]|nr:hypothetical protein [Chloroflexota bacterium]
MTVGAEARALVTAAVGAAVLVLVGGVLAITSGQLFLVGVTAAATGLLAAGSERPKPWLRRYAIVLALVVVAVGAVGTWLIALGQGGSLGLLDFLWATSGLLVPAEAIVAVLAAAWGANAGPVRG